MKRLASCLAVVALAVSTSFANLAHATLELPTFTHNGRGDFGTGEVDVEVIFNSVATDLYNVIVDLSLIYHENATWEVLVTPAEGTEEVKYFKNIRNESGFEWSLFTVEAIGVDDIFNLNGSTSPNHPPVPTKENHSLVYDVGDLAGSGENFDISYGIEPDSPYSLHLTPTVIPEPTTFIDIKPESFPNSVNLKSNGFLPVAILGSATFDVDDPNTGVDISTLVFGDPNSGGTALSPVLSVFEDVNADGFLDISLKFSIADLVNSGALGADTMEGTLIGSLFDASLFKGMDSIRIVPGSFLPAPLTALTAAVPEPTTLALTALGLLGIGWRRRKQA